MPVPVAAAWVQGEMKWAGSRRESKPKNKRFGHRWWCRRRRHKERISSTHCASRLACSPALFEALEE